MQGSCRAERVTVPAIRLQDCACLEWRRRISTLRSALRFVSQEQGTDPLHAGKPSPRVMSSASSPGVGACVNATSGKATLHGTGKARSPAPTIDTATTVQRLIARKPTSQIHIQLSVQVTEDRIDADHLDPTGRRSDRWHGFDGAQSSIASELADPCASRR